MNPYGQPQAQGQMTMELLASQPLSQVMQVPQAPFIPQVNFPQALTNDIVFITTTVVNIISAKAQQSPIRMFLFNQMSMNGWQNPDFAEMMEVIVNNAAAWLMGGNQFSNVADWANEAVDPLVTERMCENVKYWPNLIQTVDQNSAVVIGNLVNKFQERRMEVQRFLQHNQIPAAWIGYYNPAQAIQNYPSVQQYQQPQMVRQPAFAGPGGNYAQGRPVNMGGMSASGYTRPGQQPMTQHQMAMQQRQWRDPQAAARGNGGLFQTGNNDITPLPSINTTFGEGTTQDGMTRYERQLLRQQGRLKEQQGYTQPQQTQPQFEAQPVDRSLMGTGSWKNPAAMASTGRRDEASVLQGGNPFLTNKEMGHVRPQPTAKVGDLGSGGGAELSPQGFSTTPEAAARTQAAAAVGRGPAIHNAVQAARPVASGGEDLTPFEWREIQMLPRGLARGVGIGTVIAAKAGSVFLDPNSGALSDHCIMGTDEEGMLTGYLPQVIKYINLTQDPALPPYRPDPSGVRTREHYDEFIESMMGSVKTPEEAAFIVTHERHRLSELEARIIAQHGNFAANVPEEVRPQTTYATAGSLTQAQRESIKSVYAPRNAAIYQLFTKLGIPEVRTPAEIAWASSEYQPYPPAYPRRTHKLQYLVFPNGVVIADVVEKTATEKEENKIMDYEAHRIGNLPTQPSAQTDGKPAPTVSATPEPKAADIKIDFREKESVNLSDNEAIAEATLRAFFKDRVIGMTSGVRSVQTIAHPLVCDDVVTAQFYREFLNKLQNTGDIEEIAQQIRDELTKPEHMLLRNHLDDVLTDRINEALAVNMQIGWDITSFIDDVTDLVHSIRTDETLGEKMVNIFKTGVLVSVQGSLGVLDDNFGKEFVETYLDTLEGDLSYPNRIVFVTKRVAITHLGVSYQELEFATGPQKGAFQVGESLPVLHEVARQLFTSNEIKGDDTITQFVVLRDGIKLVIYKGWLGVDFYLGRVIKTIH